MFYFIKTVITWAVVCEYACEYVCVSMCHVPYVKYKDKSLCMLIQ